MSKTLDPRFFETKTTVREVIDAKLSGNQLISVRGISSDSVSLTVGARRCHQVGGYFYKHSLKELIDLLTDIHDTL